MTYSALETGLSGLQAQRTRLNTIANNVLNARTTRNALGESVPYQRRQVVFEPGRADDPSKPGVHVSEITLDRSPGQREYDPGHPDAGDDGYVLYPNVHLAVEYVNAMEASRAYEANITMMQATKAMANATLRLIA